MAALARNGSPLVPLLQYRFSRATNQLNGQSLGNHVLAALAEKKGDFAEAVDQLSRLVGTTGRVFPSTGENVSLRAEFVTGEVLAGETAIVQRRCPIWRLSLERPVQPLPDAIRALVNADGVVVGPGSLYTSLLPNLLVGGIAPTISGIDAVRIYVANLMTQPGETEGFDVGAHLRVIREHAGGDLFDYVVVNRGGIDEAVAREYAQRGAYPVAFSGSPGGAMEIVECDLIDRDALPEVRHSSAALASVILDLVRRGRPRTQ
jgi:uncharacterized cofD-like protein